MKQHDIILAYLKFLYAKAENDGWIAPYKLRGLDTIYGFIGDAADVRLRELRREGKVESRGKGRFVEFRIITAPPGQLFIPSRQTNINAFTEA